jgi:predicted DNA binding CopG/RHH family protein
MARPKADNGKDKRITIAVDDELDQQIKEAAQRESMPVSILLRRLIIDGLRRLQQGQAR